jgi:uncharacterized membrane protein
VPTGLILLSLVPAIAGTVQLTELANGAHMTIENERFVRMPIPIILHLLSVIPYTLVGAFQFSSSFRRRHRDWHRAAGRVLVLLGIMVALTGLWMTIAYPITNVNNDGVAVWVMRLIVGSWMTLSIILAVNAVRRRDFKTHGAWMIRGYAIGLGAGTQVLTHVPYFILVGKPDELARALMMGSAWVINFVVAEWIIRRQPKVAPRSRREVQHAF